MSNNTKITKPFLFLSSTLFLCAALVATSCTGVNHRAGINQIVITRSLQDEINEEIDWSRNIYAGNLIFVYYHSLSIRLFVPLYLIERLKEQMAPIFPACG